MTQIQKGKYLFLIDIEDTKEHHKNLELCECPNCQNFYTQIKGKFPRLDVFLEEFGIDVEKPDAIDGAYLGNHAEYTWIDYTVSGRMEAIDGHKVAYEEQLELKLDDFPATIVISEHFIFPNEREGECFAVSIKGLSLPWVLEEERTSPPISDEEQTFTPILEEEHRPNEPGLFAKLKQFFVKIMDK